MDENILIGKKLRYYRLIKGISQVQTAEYLGITFQQVQKYESGKNRISLPTAKKVCELYNISLDELFGQESIPQSRFDSRNMELFKYFNLLPVATQQKLVDFVKQLAGTEKT